MPEAVAGTAEGDEVVGVVGAAVVSRVEVVDFEEACAVAAGGLAVVVVAGQDLAAGAGWDGCGVAAALGADGGVAAYSFGFCAAEFAFSGVGLGGHAAG